MTDEKKLAPPSGMYKTTLVIWTREDLEDLPRYNKPLQKLAQLEARNRAYTSSIQTHIRTPHEIENDPDWDENETQFFDTHKTERERDDG